MFPGGPLASYSNQHLYQLKSFARLKSVGYRNTRSLLAQQIFLSAKDTLLQENRELAIAMGGRGKEVGFICEVNAQNAKKRCFYSPYL